MAGGVGVVTNIYFFYKIVAPWDSQVISSLWQLTYRNYLYEKKHNHK